MAVQTYANITMLWQGYTVHIVITASERPSDTLTE